MQVRLTGDSGFAGWIPALTKGLTVAAVAIAISLPALPQVTSTGTSTSTTTATGTTTGAIQAVFCSVPSTVSTGATGATSTGVTGATSTGATSVTTTSGTTAITVNCAAQGATPTQQNIGFTAEARVPASFVLAQQAPVLPTSLFNSIMAGTSELRQFVALSGDILTFDLLAVQAGTPLPFSATLPTGTATLVMPTGTLINEIRIQVQNVTVTGGLHPTMLFSGVVSSVTGSTGTTGTTGATGSVTVGEAGVLIPTTSGGTGEPGSPLVPNLFGSSLQGNAAAVSLGFNSSFPFPGISSTSSTATGTSIGSTGATSTGITGSSGLTGGASATTGATGVVGTGMNGGTGTSSGNTGTGLVGGTSAGNTGATSTGSTSTGSTSTGVTGGTSTATGFGGTQGTNGAVPASMLNVNVAGAFDLASPTGFAAVDVTSGTTGTTGTTGATGTTSTGPVIQLAPFNFQTATRSITLDASQSSSPNGALTFSWTSVGQQTAAIAGANTANPTISFPTPGTFQIQLTVTDASGASSTVVIPITVMM